MEAGEQLGSYTILRRLGAGGMGEVYLAEHRHLHRRSAVKVLRPELSANQEMLARFFTEARATAAIHHPGIVEVLDCDVHPGGQAYIVMELLEGESLRDHLDRIGCLAGDLQTAIAIAGQLAAALDAAHARGIVHRDLKPDNVFLTGAPTPGQPPLVKILDFGIAKLVSDDAHSNTRTGALLGTPLYMSPEQCRGAQRVDHRTDIYSLGCILFELLAGRPPFVGEGPGDLLVAHVTEPPPAIDEVQPGIPGPLAELVAWMLAKDPGERPQSMREIGAAIEKILQVLPGRVATMMLPSPAPGVTARRLGSSAQTTLGAAASELRGRSRRSPQLAAALIAASVAAAAGAAVLVSRRWDEARGLRTAAQTAGARPGSAAPAVVAPTVAPPQLGEPRRAVTAAPVEIVSDPPGAEVWVDGEGQPRGRTPVLLAAPRSGVVGAILKSRGYADARVTLTPATRGPLHVALDSSGVLTKSPARPRRKAAAEKTASSFRAVGD